MNPDDVFYNWFQGVQRLHIDWLLMCWRFGAGWPRANDGHSEKKGNYNKRPDFKYGLQMDMKTKMFVGDHGRNLAVKSGVEIFRSSSRRYPCPFVQCQRIWSSRWFWSSRLSDCESFKANKTQFNWVLFVASQDFADQRLLLGAYSVDLTTVWQCVSF